jgi:cardiolipin synthase A/B
VADCRSAYVGSNPTPPSQIKKKSLGEIRMRKKKMYKRIVYVVFITCFISMLYQPAHADQPNTLLITEVYYHTHSNVHDEYIAVNNPTTDRIDLTGYYLTDEPWKIASSQAKLMFPNHTMLNPGTTLYLTQNATAFLRETGRLPDFEYKDDSHSEVPQLKTYKTVTFSNTGGLVAIKDSQNTTIDLIIYGKTNTTCSGWNGSTIPDSGTGVVLKRNIINGIPQDTDTASDWIHPRIYGVGQSDFPLRPTSFTGDITMFVSPDSSYQTIVQELRNAHQSIDFNIYEFTNPFLYKELLAALNRNVKVRVFAEGSPIGGITDTEKYILRHIEEAGGTVRLLASDTKNAVNARYQFDHAKYLIIDNDTVIVESCNWAKTGVPKNPSYGNREWGIVIRNSDVANVFLQVFEDDWNPQHCDSILFKEMNYTIPSYISLDDSVPTGSYTPKFNATKITGPIIATPIFSPDTSEPALCDAIDTATTSIYIEQLYIYKDWTGHLSPLVEHLVNKSRQGVPIKVILDYNPEYTDTIAHLNETKNYLEEHNISVKFISPPWSPFTTVHNKGMIIDNTTVLISSINWNQQSVTLNREAGVLIENPTVATYYATVFLSDWNLDSHPNNPGFQWADYKYIILIAVVFIITFALIIRDWRKRKWK